MIRASATAGRPSRRCAPDRDRRTGLLRRQLPRRGARHYQTWYQQAEEDGSDRVEDGEGRLPSVPAARADRVPGPHRSPQRRWGRAVAPLPGPSQGAGQITALPVIRRHVVRGVPLVHGGGRGSVSRALAHPHCGHHAEDRQRRVTDGSDEICHRSGDDTRRGGVAPVPWPLAARRARGPKARSPGWSSSPSCASGYASRGSRSKGISSVAASVCRSSTTKRS